MAPRTRRLGVWLGGLRVADLEQRRWNELRCRYTPEAQQRWPANTPVLSCSLPLGARPRDAMSFAKGLLPEGQALQTLAARAGLAVNATFDLLARYGRDVAGALVIGEDEPDTRRWAVEAYSDATLERAVDELDEHPLGAHDDSELSLAGLQDKLLLVDLGDGRWGRPVGGRPSTHILKVDDARHPGLVAAESECLALARAAGLTTVEHRLRTLADRPCLIISRFDRRTGSDGTVERVHQEDLCQALGLNPEAQRGRGKYEAAGGPTFRQAATLLDTYGPDPEAELDRLVAIMTFTVLIGNADAHGKNLALLHPEPGTVALAPLYDTVPTVLWPRLRTDAAMSIGGQRSLPVVTLDDLVREAATWPHSAQRARDVAVSTIGTITSAVVDATSPLGTSVRERADRLLA